MNQEPPAAVVSEIQKIEFPNLLLSYTNYLDKKQTSKIQIGFELETFTSTIIFQRHRKVVFRMNYLKWYAFYQNFINHESRLSAKGVSITFNTNEQTKKITLQMEEYTRFCLMLDFIQAVMSYNSGAELNNSIRHNLSLHNRFMRVQNEGTGKSSWWMLNPDAKPGKSVRRRAASMETSKYEKRRGRAKKRVEALKQAGITGINDATPSPCSSVSEGLDHFPESPLHSGGFQLSPDFRQRASSNASSCGRLSPIPALVGVEPDWGFGSTQGLADYQNSTITPAQSQTLDQLAGSFADELTIQKDIFQGFSNASITNQPPPPYQPPQPYSLHATVAQSYGIQQSQCALHRSLPCTCLHNSREGLSPSSGTGMSPSYPHSEPSTDSLNAYTQIDNSLGQHKVNNTQLEDEYIQTNFIDNTASTLIGQCMEALNSQNQMEDFNLESFHGGLECNVEELIQQELSIDGLLDINIPLNANQQAATANRHSNMLNNQQHHQQHQQQEQQQQHQRQQTICATSSQNLINNSVTTSATIIGSNATSVISHNSLNSTSLVGGGTSSSSTTSASVIGSTLGQIDLNQPASATNSHPKVQYSQSSASVTRSWVH